MQETRSDRRTDAGRVAPVSISASHRPWLLSYASSDRAAAKTSWARHGLPTLYPAFVSAVAARVRLHPRHLDIGCGDGTKTLLFGPHPVVGIDRSAAAIATATGSARARKDSAAHDFTVADCLRLPFADHAFTSASDILCFTHLNPSEAAAYKHEVSRVLSIDGHLLLVLFSLQDEHFHGHEVSKRYTFAFQLDNPLMRGYEHYDGMHNVHFDAAMIQREFENWFDIVAISEVRHPLYEHRYLWNVILRKG